MLKSEAIDTFKKVPVIPVNRVVDKKRIKGKRRAKEEERHQGSLTKKCICTTYQCTYLLIMYNFLPTYIHTFSSQVCSKNNTDLHHFIFFIICT
jgi:hypothetical protein